MNVKKARVGIVGASGYSGEELVRLMLLHPHVELAAVTSRQYAGQTASTDKTTDAPISNRSSGQGLKYVSQSA